ncbi:hypothetical protein FA13DRAFT_1710219 [Coprinellus micaceus]|uniref:Uncharacterized protein n=1 Tax=Coprinellus micaceus TaxID=71717 RepID=A0A4Y7TAF1_COPMI|nr:hypothetical protein FA13DRAFT_1710219 [Coprinellus micaceus]
MYCTCESHAGALWEYFCKKKVWLPGKFEKLNIQLHRGRYKLLANIENHSNQAGRIEIQNSLGKINIQTDLVIWIGGHHLLQLPMVKNPRPGSAWVFSHRLPVLTDPGQQLSKPQTWILIYLQVPTVAIKSIAPPPMRDLQTCSCSIERSVGTKKK